MTKDKVGRLERMSIKNTAIIGFILNALIIIIYNSIFSTVSVSNFFLITGGIIALAYLISIPILKKKRLIKIISWFILLATIFQIILIVGQFVNIHIFFSYPLEILVGIVLSCSSMVFSTLLILKAYNKKLSKDAAWLTMAWQSP